VSITGTVRVRCPACAREQDVQLVQAVNAAKDVAVKKRLLAGELNVLECECGKRTPLAANVVFHDPAKDLFIRVVPGGDDKAMAEAAAQFRAAGVTGVQRLVPSLNALIEKVKIFDAGLEDWAIEMTKVLLLSTTGTLDVVLLFAIADEHVLRWVRFDAYGRSPEPVASPRDAYERIASREASRPAPDEYQIDRAWAVEAVRAMIAASN
jgi:hypothetical protein